MIAGLALMLAPKPAPTVTVSWTTSLVAGHSSAKNASDVTWPQTLGDPGCGAVIQTDIYRYGENYKAAVDALIANGVLNRPGSAEWTDSAFVISWSFTVEEPCPTVSPSPSSTTTSPDPSPSWSASPPRSPFPTDPTTPTTSPTPTPTPPAVQSPSPSVSTKKTFTPSPKATQSATPPALPFTGAPTVWLAALGSGLVLLGAGALVVAGRRP